MGDQFFMKDTDGPSGLENLTYALCYEKMHLIAWAMHVHRCKPAWIRVWSEHRTACFRTESSCEEHCSLWCTDQRGGTGSGNATPWVTADSNWRTWLLAGAGQADGNTQNGITERKKRTHPIIDVYLLSYKLICMWGFSSSLSLYAIRLWCRKIYVHAPLALVFSEKFRNG